ncbi:MAG: Crp/Fnr family transcriptional regulator [Clostridiales bacterium]|nr:Crp/Fnr family transcriptional regulator [Bacillota bacterium]NLK03758.1 Crp/Fnr family transcriptional regulator [Clostridiales bacterium]
MGSSNCRESSCNGEHEHHNSCITRVPIFNHLADDQMDEILELTNSMKYKKGEVIYRAGEDSDSLYIVRSGKIKIYRLSEAGKEQLVRILYEGDFTGELALFSETIHEAYAEAMEETWVCTVRRVDLQALLIKYPSISLKLLNEFSNRLGESEKQTTRFATEKVETRLALYFLEYSDENKSLLFKLPMSRKDLASFLGTTPETISRKLLELEEEGLIMQKPKNEIEIINYEGLKLYCKSM